MGLRVRLRPAVLRDVETLVRFSAAMADETESRTLDLTRLRQGVAAVLTASERGFFRVAQVAQGRSQQIVGQLMVTYEWSDWRNGTFWWIQSVYVEPSWRRRGVYRAMHEEIRREARSTPGVCGLRLYVEQGNHAAQRAYREVGMRRAYYHVFEDDFVLSHTHIQHRATGRLRPGRLRGVSR